QVNEKDRIVGFGKRSVFQLAPDDPYYVENALEALDEPGEWYLDPTEAKVYYMPRAGEWRETVEAIAPALITVVRMEGHPKDGHFVERVTFRDLTFAHTEWCFPAGFDSAKNKPTVSPEPAAQVGGFAQAAIGVPGAVWGEGVRRCVFENCQFS